jgi:thermitase
MGYRSSAGVVARFVVVGVLALGAFGATAGAAPGPGTSGEQILVKFHPGTSAQTQAYVNGRHGGTVASQISAIGVQVVHVPAGQTAAAARAYAAEPTVAYAEPDGTVTATEVPNDPSFNLQWGMAKVQAPDAWGVTHGSASVPVAVLDTGVQASHPDLAGKVVAAKNFTSSTTLDDVYGHGTHVAGIAAAVSNNSTGVAGLGWNVTVMNAKVLGDNGSGSLSSVAQGVTWAADNGARVINMSLGGTTASSTLDDAINYASNKGVVVVAAAGNNASSAPFYPAYSTNVIAVAASNEWDQLAPYSDYGTWVDMAAPGSNIYSTLPGSTYGNRSGTSMASPHVAGLAALVSGQVSDTNGNGRINDEVRARIESTTDNVGLAIGGGRINAYRAVQNASSPPPPTTGTVAGRVTDASTGSAVAGATVSTSDASATTDAAGNYTLGNVATGTVTVSASASGYLAGSQSVSVTAGASTTTSFALTKATGAIAGTVTDASSGSAIAGATVSAGSSSTVTNASGTYTLTGMNPGTITVNATANGYTNASKTISITSGTTTTATFLLSATPTVVTETFSGSLANRNQPSSRTHTVTVSNAGPLTATVAWNKKATLTFTIYNSSGSAVSSGGGSGTSATSTVNATAGTYSIVVRVVSGQSSYTLTVTHS